MSYLSSFTVRSHCVLTRTASYRPALCTPSMECRCDIISTDALAHFFAAFVLVLSFGNSRTYGKNSLQHTHISPTLNTLTNFNEKNYHLRRTRNPLPQDLRNFYTVLPLIILQHTAQRPLRRAQRRIQRVHVFFPRSAGRLFRLLGPVPDLELAGLVVGAVGCANEFFVFLLEGEPGLEIFSPISIASIVQTREEGREKMYRISSRRH
jgi:hypothetical protein